MAQRSGTFCVCGWKCLCNYDIAKYKYRPTDRPTMTTHFFRIFQLRIPLHVSAKTFSGILTLNDHQKFVIAGSCAWVLYTAKFCAVCEGKATGKCKVYRTTSLEGTEGEQRYSSTLPLTSALDGVGGQRHASAALPPGKTRYPLYRRLGGTQGRSGRVRKISASPGFDHRTVQPVASRYTD
jgi:hypothetical protein